MSTTKNTKTPEQLYREYQETRDNIPNHLFSEITEMAASAQHDDAIHQLLQEAKIRSNQTDGEQANSPAQKASWLSKLFSSRPSPAWNGAFASLAVVAICVPVGLNMLSSNNSSHYAQYAHLSDCENCSNYIAQATAGTRGSAPGINQLDPNARAAARLGRYSAMLKIAALNEQTNSKVMDKLSNLPEAYKGAELKQLLEGDSPDSAELIGTLERQAEVSPNAAYFSAAEAIMIAQVSAIREINEASDQKNFNAAAQLAATKLGELESKTILQQSIFDSLNELDNAEGIERKTRLEKSTELYRRALEALGG